MTTANDGAPSGTAIVGMACVMPGAPDLEAFWAGIVDGVDAVTEVDPRRWDPDLHFDPDHDPGERRTGQEPMSVSKWGGWIPDVGFDALAWGIPPTSLASIDPAQLLALKAAAAALDDAGCGPEGPRRDFDRDRTSLVYATGSGGASELPAGFLLRLMLRSHGAGPLPADLDAFLPRLTEDGLPGVLTSLIAGRVANRLDLGGKNLTVDSACASVLVALDIACNELTAGTADLVLCGGVDLHNGAQDYVSFTAAGALSPRGRCHSFDRDADGMTLAEGVGCIVLKRLADADRDGDRVYAVVRGVAGSSDGRHLGLTAPRREGQEKAVRRAYAAAGISPAEVGLVEAHGTGTSAGDRTELDTMTRTFGEAGARPGSVVLGTVKSNIGHIKCAAGIASLIKTAKALHHGVLPPTLHISQPNEIWDQDESPFVFLDHARPWLDDRRVAGVSAFGFGGTNFHAVLENHRSPEPGRIGAPASGRPHWPAELIGFRAANDADLAERLDRLARRLADELHPPRQADRLRLRDIAAAESAAGDGPVRLAIVARDVDELAARVDAARSGRPDDDVYRPDPAVAATGPDTGPPGVAFLFPGPAGVRPGMASDVLVAFPGGRDPVRYGRDCAAAMLPPQSFGPADRARRSTALAAVAEQAATLVGLTTARLLVACGLTPADRAAHGHHRIPFGPPETPAPHGDPDVAFHRDIRRIAAGGVSVFVDVGPGDHLTRLVDRELADTPHLAVAVDRPGGHGVVNLLRALARLAVAGVPVDLDWLHAGRGSDPERWINPGPRPGWIVNGHFARTAAGEPLPNGLRPADRTPPVRLLDPDRPPAAGNGDRSSPGGPGVGDAGLALGELTAVTEYLRIVHDVISAGSRIVHSQVEPSGQDR